MAELKLVAIIAVFCIHCSAAKECWVTDPVALEAKDSNPNSVRNCQEFIQENIKKYRLPVDPNIVRLIPTTCYTIKVTAGPPIGDFVTKGCVPMGACHVVKEITRSELAAKGYLNAVSDITCEECFGPRCNQN